MQHVDYQRQAFPDAQSHVIHQAHGCGTRATVGTVDRYKIRCRTLSALIDGIEQIVEPAIGTDYAFESNRLAGDFADMSQRVQQLIDVVDLGWSPLLASHRRPASVTLP